MAAEEPRHTNTIARLCNFTAGRFSFSTMHFQQSAAQRTAGIKKWVIGEQANNVGKRKSKANEVIRCSRVGEKKSKRFESDDRN